MWMNKNRNFRLLCLLFECTVIYIKPLATVSIPDMPMAMWGRDDAIRVSALKLSVGILT